MTPVFCIEVLDMSPKKVQRLRIFGTSALLALILFFGNAFPHALNGQWIDCFVTVGQILLITAVCALITGIINFFENRSFHKTFESVRHYYAVEGKLLMDGYASFGVRTRARRSLSSGLLILTPDELHFVPVANHANFERTFALEDIETVYGENTLFRSELWITTTDDECYTYYPDDGKIWAERILEAAKVKQAQSS